MVFFGVLATIARHLAVDGDGEAGGARLRSAAHGERQKQQGHEAALQDRSSGNMGSLYHK
jgi:hypothetical protein